MRIFFCIAVTLFATVSCSKSSPDEQKARLVEVKGEWTHEQTDKAIDIYLDGLRREEELLDRNLELREQLRFFDENRCSRDVLRQRRAEIDSTRARLDAKRERINKISK